MISHLMEALADGLWRWTARHPEWHPAGFGDEVASFALCAHGIGLLIDPLLPPDPEPVHALVGELARDDLAILITVPYHVRSAEQLRRRHGKRVSIWGHEAAAKRLSSRAGFHVIDPDSELPAGVRAHRVGSPPGHELPLYIPAQRALAFGDEVVEVGGRLRVWKDPLDSERRRRWYRERYIPTLEPLLELDVERVLVTHGEPVLADGRKKLAAALRAEPWSRHTG
jgi:hypothetical protein